MMDGRGKADRFADTIAEKCRRNSWTCAQSLELQAAVACPTVEQCMAVLAGQVPTSVPTHIHKRCAKVAGQADAVLAAAYDRDSFLV